MLNGSYPSLGRSQPLGRNSQITMVQTPSVEVLLEDKRSWLWWWHRIAGPPELPASASFKQRDQVRRGRLASTILFWVTILLIIVMPVGIFGSDHIIFPLALGALIVAAIAVYCNRRGWINVVGILLALSLNGSIALSIIKNPGGLSPSIENSFDLLVFGDVFVVSLLAPGWVVVSALCNIAFIIFEMLFAPRTPLFRTVAATD